ncbi:alpha/beta fold hydrolase [Granulosicoccus antarcticus]|uniref:3-oxoadipate enol-lactonase 2 n=1 Tax=Granulosicoccus antarcticus IMCC3135 TaxID=1192854 RepID=A0A2Z2NXV2_9GAMM|nr:alpha/beta hydrolase [Granulosicoccus antarcticus]ASJ76296.1 3-oxoadipate enol-lactonase 2 [Granulosicoccus antarcticus IMCC3135]
MPLQPVDGIAIHYEQHSSSADTSAATILLLHGLGSSTLDWSEQIPALLPVYDVLVVDLRGHGQSDKPTGPYSIRQMANDIARALELSKLHVVGLSMGAQIALQLALDHPDIVATVTAVNSPADMKPRRVRDKLAVMQRKLLVRLLGMRLVGQVIAGRLLPGDEFAERRQLFANRWADNDPASYRASLNAILDWDITPELSHISQAILVIAASDDYTPLAWKQRIVELAPNALMVVIENSRHAIPVERPQAFNAALLEFLSRNSRLTAPHL